jgi:HEAT repeat protein
MRTLLLLALIAGLPAVAADVLWTPQQVVEALKGDDYQKRDLAEGYLYLLPESTFPQLTQVHDARPDQHVDRWAKRITRALLLRGYKPMIRGYLSNFYAGFTKTGPSQVAYSLDEQQLLEQTVPAELEPLCRAFADHLAKIPKNSGLQHGGNDLWVRLAGITGEPSLMHHVLLLAGSPQARFARPQMIGRFDPDRCSQALLPLMSKGETPLRQEVIRMLRSGWQQGPVPAVATLMRDPEPAIRLAFAQSLLQSSSAEALEVIVAGLEDSDALVRGQCLSALGSYRGEPQIKLLRRIALEERLDVGMRQQAWSILTHGAGDPLTTEAKALVQNANANQMLRSTAVSYLLAHAGARWLLDVVPRLEPQMKAEVLSRLAQSGSPEVLGEITTFLRRAEAPLLTQVLSALASVKNSEAVYPLLISYLKDARPEVRRAAADTLGRASGLSYWPASAQAEGGEKDLHRAWSRWYDLIIAEPAPLLAGDVATLRSALAASTWKEGEPLPTVVGEMFPALVRLIGDRTVGSKAVMALARTSDPRTAAMLLDLIDGPLYSTRSSDFTRALMITRADPNQAPHLFKLLGDTRTKALAVRVLVAWRIASPALTGAILSDSGLPSDLLSELLAWKDCPVLSAARKMMVDDKADEQLRMQAMNLIVQLGDERDVKALAREVAEVGPSYRRAVQGLVRMATEGSDSANRELVRLIQSAPRKGLAKPARPLRDKPAVEPTNQKPDPVPEILQALKSRPRGEKGAVVPLAEPLPRVIAEWTRSADEEQQIAGLALLLEANSREGIEVLRVLLQSSQRTLAQQAFALPLDLRTPEARPFVEVLGDYPGLDERGVARIVDWYRDVAKVPIPEWVRLREELRQRQERLMGKPVRGLVLTVDMEGDSAPIGAKGLTARVKIKNVGKSPYSFYTTQTGFGIRIRMSDADRGEYTREVSLEVKPKQKAGGGIEPIVIAPGQTFTAMTTPFDAPPRGYEALAHRVRFVWRVPVSLGTQDSDGDATFTTPWFSYTFLPPLWEAIDRRHSAR